MNCSVCGAMIPDGQSNCPNCGAMVQSMGQPVQPMGGYQQPNMGQPVQPMGGYQQPNMGQPMGGYQQSNMGQPMGGYQQPKMGKPMGGSGFGGFANSLSIDIMKIVGLVGALFIFLAPFFSWFKFKMSFWGITEKGSVNMFGLAGGEYKVSALFAVFAILLILIGAVLILWEVADYVPALGNIKAKISGIPFIELIIIAVALVIIIIAFANGDVREGIKGAKEFGSAGHGAGPVLGFLGVIVAAVPRVLKMLNINIGRR